VIAERVSLRKREKTVFIDELHNLGFVDFKHEYTSN
jgi:hypothetical protein